MEVQYSVQRVLHKVVCVDWDLVDRVDWHWLLLEGSMHRQGRKAGELGKSSCLMTSDAEWLAAFFIITQPPLPSPACLPACLPTSCLPALEIPATPHAPAARRCPPAFAPHLFKTLLLHLSTPPLLLPYNNNLYSNPQPSIDRTHFQQLAHFTYTPTPVLHAPQPCKSSSRPVSPTHSPPLAVRVCLADATATNALS
jgi:hypothetical protein